MPWVFGYGSLMWRPGFAYTACLPARLEGWRRAFCRYSFRHRGTRERPGLVVGLREGAGCDGLAYAVAPADEPAVLAYLDEREGAGYHRRRLPVRLADDGRTRTEEAWVYVPNPDHPSYFGEADTARIVDLVANGRGESGTAYDYLRELVQRLEALGVSEPALADVLRRVERRRAGAP